LSTLATQRIVQRVLERNNLPGSICVALTGGADIGEAIAKDKRIPLVSFTGSTKVKQTIFSLLPREQRMISFQRSARQLPLTSLHAWVVAFSNWVATMLLLVSTSFPDATLVQLFFDLCVSADIFYSTPFQ